MRILGKDGKAHPLDKFEMVLKVCILCLLSLNFFNIIFFINSMKSLVRICPVHTHIRLYPQTFCYRYAFRQHVSGENTHLKPQTFENGLQSGNI